MTSRQNLADNDTLAGGPSLGTRAYMPCLDY